MRQRRIEQVTQCHDLGTPRGQEPRRAPTTLLLALLASFAALAGGGCGAGTAPAPTRSSSLVGWHPVDDTPGISQLAPDLAGLRVATRADLQALVRNGDAIRSATFTFATAKEAAEARKRGAGDDYQAKLERAFHGDTVGHGPGVGLRLRVPRPTGRGSDTVEVYLLVGGRRLTIVELLSARGFDPELRDRLLRRLSR